MHLANPQRKCPPIQAHTAALAPTEAVPKLSTQLTQHTEPLPLAQAVFLIHLMPTLHQDTLVKIHTKIEHPLTLIIYDL